MLYVETWLLKGKGGKKEERPSRSVKEHTAETQLPPGDIKSLPLRNTKPMGSSFPLAEEWSWCWPPDRALGLRDLLGQRAEHSSPQLQSIKSYSLCRASLSRRTAPPLLLVERMEPKLQEISTPAALLPLAAGQLPNGNHKRRWEKQSVSTWDTPLGPPGPTTGPEKYRLFANIW